MAECAEVKRGFTRKKDVCQMDNSKQHKKLKGFAENELCQVPSVDTFLLSEWEGKILCFGDESNKLSLMWYQLFCLRV